MNTNEALYLRISSKEALYEILNAETEEERSYLFIKYFELIERDLEAADILKNNICLDEQALDNGHIELIHGYLYDTVSDGQFIIGWLEDEKNY